jgi:hypothetical protein
MPCHAGLLPGRLASERTGQSVEGHCCSVGPPPHQMLARSREAGHCPASLELVLVTSRADHRHHPSALEAWLSLESWEISVRWARAAHHHHHPSALEAWSSLESWAISVRWESGLSPPPPCGLGERDALSSGQWARAAHCQLPQERATAAGRQSRRNARGWASHRLRQASPDPCCRWSRLDPLFLEVGTQGLLLLHVPSSVMTDWKGQLARLRHPSAPSAPLLSESLGSLETTRTAHLPHKGAEGSGRAHKVAVRGRGQSRGTLSVSARALVANSLT